MQDSVQAIGAGGGRIFSGAFVGDRRLRPHGHHQQQALKCPRCESPDTKFCYYNNYNLSQPRHFCRSCRRYWTNGGVLRNVPVGGGCRKANKRSSSAKAKKDHRATELIQPDRKTPATTNYNIEPPPTEDETAATVDAESGFFASTHDHPTESQHQAVEGLTCCTTMTSLEEDLTALIGERMNQTASYEDEFKVVDYGDYSTLFDPTTAAADPNYYYVP